MEFDDVLACLDEVAERLAEVRVWAQMLKATQDDDES